jgi:predicted metalloprotease with PDZ domain
LDTTIRKHTTGQKGLDDLFSIMERRFGSTGTKYTPDDLRRAASEVAGTDLTAFFSRYIASTEPLPVKECLSDAGFDASIVDYGGEVYVRQLDEASAVAREIQHQLLTGNP